MAVLKCKICGGDLNIDTDLKIFECEHCGTKQTIPDLNNEKKVNLFNRANRLRLNGEFDKATGIYESIIAEFTEEAEAYWGLCLCNYGIEYVDDPATAKKIPTCHRASFEKLSDDENFNMALEYSDLIVQKFYRDEARKIDRIMDEILSISKNEKPYDVFICYKETDDNGERTIDSVLAQDIYDALTAKGMKVFFARITLEDKLGQMYEPYIFAALNSAKVLLAIGTKYEYFHAVWVKNEWSRFLKLIAKDKSKILIPCYKDMDAYDLPKEFKALQAQDMSKIGFMQDLVRGVEKIIGNKSETITANATASPVQTQNNSIAPLLERAFIFLEDRKWESANEYCEKVLDIEPKNADAYLCKLLCDYKKTKIEALVSVTKKQISENENYIKIKRYGDEKILNQFDDLFEAINKIEANRNKVNQKLSAIDNLTKEMANDITGAEKVSNKFILKIEKELADETTEKELLIKNLYSELNSLGFFKKKEKADLQTKIDKETEELSKLKKTLQWKKSRLIEEKRTQQRNIAKENATKKSAQKSQLQEELYQLGLELVQKGEINNAYKAFKGLQNYKDSREKLKNIGNIEDVEVSNFKVKCKYCGYIVDVETKNNHKSRLMKCAMCGGNIDFNADVLN
ncbi:MAG: TIR domain-containing protein [Clostridia bacterium]|nr:TIR domain-containing protein [Clostridia bacterium]